MWYNIHWKKKKTLFAIASANHRWYQADMNMCVVIYDIYDLLSCSVLYFYFSVNLCFSKSWFIGTMTIFIWVCSKYSYHMWLDMHAINPFEYCGLDLFWCCFSAWFHSGVPISLYSFVWFPHDVIVRVMILCWYKI